MIARIGTWQVPAAMADGRRIAAAAGRPTGQGFRPRHSCPQRGATVAEANPTMRQRELAQRLRQLRASQELTVEQVADKLLCSATKISRIETGARRASLRDVRDLCQLYEVGELETGQLMSLARQAREAGWWYQYNDLGVGSYLGLELEATAITYYSMYFINGLLQTADYASAVIQGINPQIDPVVLEERVSARMRRQQLIDQPGRPRVRTLMDEAVLRRQVGGPQVMAGQLDKIAKIAAEGRVTTQVIPFSAGSMDSSDSNFTLFEFEETALPRVIHVEGLTSNLYIDRPVDIERYRESLDHLRDAALSPRDSLILITEIRDAHLRSS
jgi:transcriptional regulator with XRE-family HTH domain